MNPKGAALIVVAIAATLTACAAPAQQSSPIPTDPPAAAVTTPPFSMADAYQGAIAPTTTPAKPMPMVIFSDGTWVVGTDIEPGTYRSSGPSGGASFCFWYRLRDTTGDPSSVIAAGDSRGPITLTVKASDAAVRTSGCLWSKTP